MAAALAALVLLVGCGDRASEVPDAVAAQLDVPNESIAVVGDNLSEDFSRIDLLQATSSARDLGTQLRFVIVGDDQALVDPEPITDRYGGIALSYKSGDRSFVGAADRMDTDQWERAFVAAKAESDIGASALAFVGVLQNEGGVDRPGTVPWWLWVLLGLAVAFVLWQLWNFRQARKRAARRERNLEERQSSLVGWATGIENEIGTIRPHYSRLDATGRSTLEDSERFVTSVVPAIQDAPTIDDLDAAEIRIARTSMKLRDLRRQLDI